MPDFRLTDRRAHDLRLREVGPTAAGIWAVSGSWAMGAGTDGWVAAHYVRSWPSGGSSAKKLIAAGLWTEARRGTQDGYLFDQAEWAVEQRSAADVERDRALAADRARRSRQGRKDRELRDSGQLATGLVGVTGGEPVTRDVTRDAGRTARVTSPARHDERALLPHPLPPPSGQVGGEGYGSVGAADGPPTPTISTSTEQPPPVAGLTRAELGALDPRCTVHAATPRGTPTPSCRDCKLRRLEITTALDQAGHAEATARQDDVAARRAARDSCSDCDDYGDVLGEDGTPVDPVRRCQHPHAQPHQLRDLG